MDANQAMWEPSYPPLDSAYWYAMNLTGATFQPGTENPAVCETEDREFWHTYLRHDFVGDETYTAGIYLFSFNDADANSKESFVDKAKLVNQFCGFERGDINGDGVIGLADVVALLPPFPGNKRPLFEHLADVNNDGVINLADVIYLADYVFCVGPAPVGDWVLPDINP
jgi:hypothetical protein